MEFESVNVVGFIELLAIGSRLNLTMVSGRGCFVGEDDFFDLFGLVKADASVASSSWIVS